MHRTNTSYNLGYLQPVGVKNHYMNENNLQNAKSKKQHKDGRSTEVRLFCLWFCGNICLVGVRIH